MTQVFLIAAGFFGATGVALGAFGAHALKARLSSEALATWDTAVFYQLVHALALLAVVGAMRLPLLQAPLPTSQAAPVGFVVAGWGFLVGIVLFSGSLYGLSLGGPRLLGPVTPLGGLALILGWLGLLYAALR